MKTTTKPPENGFICTPIESVKSARKQKAGWGTLPTAREFSYKSRNNLMQAAIILESLGVENVLIVTLTLPGSTEKALDALERYSGLAVNRFNQFLRRRLRNALFLWVYEYQERGALHLSYAIDVPPSLRLRFTKEAVQNEWHRILESISKKSDVDVFEAEDGSTWRYNPEMLRVDVQQCRYSIVSYFAKHAQKKPRIDEKGRRRSPACWSNQSRALRKRVQDQSLKKVFLVCCEDHALKVIQETSAQLGGYVKTIRHFHTGKTIGNSVSTSRNQLETTRDVLEQIVSRMEGEMMAQIKSIQLRCDRFNPRVVLFQMSVNGYCQLRLTESRAHAKLLWI